MNSWDLTKTLIEMEAAKTDAILQARLRELGWVHKDELKKDRKLRIEPKDQQISKLRDILEEQGWRLRLSDVRQLYAGVIQVAQGGD